MKQTTTAKPEAFSKHWYVVDAKDQVLGRLSSQIALILRGKNKAIFSPHADCGDYVVVVNADQVIVTGQKKTDKNYYHHSQYQGGLKVVPFDKMQKKSPCFIIEHAVRLMLPKNRLGRRQFKHLFVYAGATHPHQAQKVEPLVFQNDHLRQSSQEASHG